MPDVNVLSGLNGTKVSLCQMPVIPGRPDLNADYMIREMALAVDRGVEVIIFPEMCVPGYIIGDLYEDQSFVMDVVRWNDYIREATFDLPITVIFGSLSTSKGDSNEDGRLRKYNTAFIASNGSWVGETYKTLQPNYRIFDDDRHFFSTRKVAEEMRYDHEDYCPNDHDILDHFKPIEVEVRHGVIKVGLILCEDMWHMDYVHNPTQELIRAGAEVIINLSCSPWSWQKNRKRHQVVRDLLQSEDSPVPFIYVNNTGVQNNGKNVIVFDGSSTIYKPDGKVCFKIPPYQSGCEDFTFTEPLLEVEVKERGDATELYQAIRCGLAGFFETLPPQMRKAVIGLSGGIDSALTICLLVDVLGAENVVAVNMPSRYNTQRTKNIALQIAKSLGLQEVHPQDLRTVKGGQYIVRPIGDIVDAICSITGTKPDTLSYENVQARARMEILAAISQDIGAVFSTNWNKVEAAFGYGTLYADMAGFLAAIGDLVKREVYQLTDYMNREVFGREVVPEECFTQAPSAELATEQKDPFDYGSLDRRGYHDEMVRAFTEFRKNPEWFIESYIRGQLEQELKLDAGTLMRLFPTARDFVKDLEKNWHRFYRAFFKRVQSVPVIMVSKRAFGWDLRESILSAHFTERYYRLKRQLLSEDGSHGKETVAIFGGSFNPPGLHHQRIAAELTRYFDRVIVVPCGLRPDKASVDEVTIEHRKAMVNLAFGGMSGVVVDTHDLDQGVYTRTYDLQAMFQDKFPNAVIWHVVGGDIVSGGRAELSEIHTRWYRGPEMWQEFNFAVVMRPGYQVEAGDMPACSQSVELDHLFGSGTMIRNLLKEGQSVTEWVCPKVEAYLLEQQLYR